MTRATQRATDPIAPIDTRSAAETLAVDASADQTVATEVSTDDDAANGGRFA